MKHKKKARLIIIEVRIPTVIIPIKKCLVPSHKILAILLYLSECHLRVVFYMKCHLVINPWE